MNKLNYLIKILLLLILPPLKYLICDDVTCLFSVKTCFQEYQDPKKLLSRLLRSPNCTCVRYAVNVMSDVETSWHEESQVDVCFQK